MALKIGKNLVSKTQLEYLNEAKNLSAEEAFAKLMAVVQDDDLKSGKEELHPEWVALFNKKIKSNPKIPEKYIAFLEEELIISPLDFEIISVNPEKAKLVFLLGAGASKPKPSDIPTVKELLPDLLHRARKLDRVDIQQLVDFCEQTKIENIEDLLTAAHIAAFTARNPVMLNLIRFLLFRQDAEKSDFAAIRRRREITEKTSIAFIQDALQMLFGLLSTRMLPAKPNKGHTAIANYVRQHPRSAIVTTNYDCCIDVALKSQNSPFSYMIEFANQNTESKRNQGIPLIKLHGSLNWFYCETCQTVHLIDIVKTVDDYLNDRDSYAVVSVCKQCGFQRRGLLVPPLAMKFDLAPALNPLIEQAQRAFDNADVIVVVGFSFADADLYLSRIVTKAMQNHPHRKVVVFDPDKSITERLRRQLTWRIDGFDERRVISVSGDCAELLPEFLDGTIKKRVKLRKPKYLREQTRLTEGRIHRIPW